MASPVDFISGDRYASIPFNLAKENAGAFTYQKLFSSGITCVDALLFQADARITLVAISARE